MPLQTAFYFFISCCLLALLPGPDNLYVLSQSAREGWRHGLCIIFGLCSGLVIHTAIVALGVAQLIQQSSVLYLAISVLGAIYLIYLAYLIFNAPPIAVSAIDDISPVQTKSRSSVLFKAYRQGILMNLSNPKVILFFLSFTQPFIHTELDNLTEQYIALGVLFILATLLVFGAICFFASSFGYLLKSSITAQIWFNRITAAILVALALYLLIADFH